MIRVLLNNGIMDTSDFMEGICEEIVEIEGKKKRVYKTPKDINSANGVRFEIEEGAYIIGNISNDKVKAILRTAVGKGYINCVDLGLKAVEDVNEIEDGVPYIEQVENWKLEDGDIFNPGRDPFSTVGQPIGAFAPPMGGFGGCCQPMGGFNQPMGGCCQPMGGFGQPMGGCCPPMGGLGQPMGMCGNGF